MVHAQHTQRAHREWVLLFFITLLLGAGLLFFSVIYETNYETVRPAAQACVDTYQNAGTDAIKSCIGTTFDILNQNRIRSHIFAILGMATSSASLILLLVAWRRHYNLR